MSNQLLPKNQTKLDLNPEKSANLMVDLPEENQQTLSGGVAQQKKNKVKGPYVIYTYP